MKHVFITTIGCQTVLITENPQVAIEPLRQIEHKLGFEKSSKNEDHWISVVEANKYPTRNIDFENTKSFLDFLNKISTEKDIDIIFEEEFKKTA